MTVDLGMALAVLGGIIGIAGWLMGRDKNISKDAEWRGGVNAKLDAIINISRDVSNLQDDVKDHEGRLCGVENGVKSAHHRIDELIKGE